MRPFNAHVGGNMCRAIDFSVSASGLLKGSGFGCLLHLSHIIPPICLLASEGAGTLKGTYKNGVDELEIFIPHYGCTDMLSFIRAHTN